MATDESYIEVQIEHIGRLFEAAEQAEFDEAVDDLIVDLLALTGRLSQLNDRMQSVAAMRTAKGKRPLTRVNERLARQLIDGIEVIFGKLAQLGVKVPVL